MLSNDLSEFIEVVVHLVSLILLKCYNTLFFLIPRGHGYTMEYILYVANLVCQHLIKDFYVFVHEIVSM